MIYLTVLNYLTLFFLSLTNLYLWTYIKARTLSASAQVEGWKHFRISVIYAISFIYKGVYANLIYAIHPTMENFMENHTGYWCLFYFWLIVFGELLPLALLFWYQLRRNIRSNKRKGGLLSDQERAMSHQHDRDDTSAIDVEEERKTS